MPSTNATIRNTVQGILHGVAQEGFLVALLVATMALVSWQRWGMDTALSLDPRTPGIRMSAVDDKLDGGNSVCRVAADGTRWRLDYDVRQGIAWAFCGINFTFLGRDSTPVGLDLSGFDTLIVTLEGMAGPNTSLQTQLKSLDPKVYRPGDRSSLKYLDMVLFPGGHGASRSAMPLGYFGIPTWWVARNKLPVDLQDPVRTDVREIEFLTSADIVRFGTGSVSIGKMEFKGKWIRRQRLFEVLSAIWLVYILGGLVHRLYRSVGANRNLRRQASRLHELAGTDSLTGSLNRRGFDETFAKLRSGLPEGGDTPLGVLLLDLDHFKKVNDSLGHDAGDEILRQVARILRKRMREEDICCRHGGEEFLAVFPKIPHDRLRRVAEDIRSDIQEGVVWKGRGITASLGIAHGTISELAILLKKADHAMYQAKNGGRNRVAG